MSLGSVLQITHPRRVKPFEGLLKNCKWNFIAITMGLNRFSKVMGASLKELLFTFDEKGLKITPVLQKINKKVKMWVIFYRECKNSYTFGPKNHLTFTTTYGIFEIQSTGTA
jgi:hypothetical protein